MNYRDLPMLDESFRWFGPADPVPLAYIRQAGAGAVFTALHEIPYGEAWPMVAIKERQDVLARAGLRWTVAESVPVHEDIKTGSGDLKRLFENYRTSLRNLGRTGITTVIYNFMPVLDWVRTDMRHVLPDGSECLQFNPVHFAAFEIHALERVGAEEDFTPRQVEEAAGWWRRLTADRRAGFVRDIIDVFPGCKLGLDLDDIRTMLARYAGIGRSALFANLGRFLDAVLPAAEEAGVRLAIHPDDPPFPVLGLPRIVCNREDIERVFDISSSPSHGLCFCTGSLGALADNDLPEMARRFASRIHAVHLRSTRREKSGAFYEAGHLDGSFSMPEVIRGLLDEQDRRIAAGRGDWRLPMRPDHGHTMMDDQGKAVPLTPGYSAIGRMRGLAELRGVMHGLRASEAIRQHSAKP
jgi:mannonate dehydratase